MYSPNMSHGRMGAMFHRSSIGAVDEPIRLSPRTSGHYVPPASQYKSASLRLPHAVDDAAQYYSHKSSPALNAHQRSPRPSYPHHQNDEWKDTSYKYNQQAREERHATDPYTISGYESSRAGSYMKSVHQHDSLRPENSPYLTTKMQFRDRASKDAAFTSIEPRHASRLEETDVYAWDPNMQANITDPVGSQECFLPSTSYDTSHHRKHQTILPRALTLDTTAIKSSKAQPTVASPAAVHAHSSRLFAREARIREGSEIPERHDFRHERATSSTAAMMLSPNPVDEHTSPSHRSPHCAKDSVRYPSQSPSTQPNYGMVNTRFPLHSTSRKAQEKVMDHRGKQEEYHYLEHRTPDPLQEERIFGRSRIGGHRSPRDCYHQVDSVGSNLSEESDSVREERIPLREPHNRGSHPHSRNTRSRRTVNSEHRREEQSRERRCMETDGTVSDEEEGYIREDRQAAKHRLEHGRSSKANRYIVLSDGIEYEEAPRALHLPATISPRATSRHRRRTKPDRSYKQNSTRKPSDVPTSENAQRRHRSGSKDPKIRNHSRMQRSATRSASPYSRHSLEPSVPSSRTARGQNEDRGRIQENHKFDPLVRSGGVEQRCSIAQGSPHSPNDLQALDTLDDIRNRVLNIVAIGEQFDLAMQKAVSRNRKRQEGASEMAVARYECIQALTDSVKHIHYELIDLLETSQGASGM